MTSLFKTVLLILAIFPLCKLQAQVTFNNALNTQLVQWLNTLFYLPPEGELRVRKEYRLLSDSERRDFHRAILLLKQDRTIPPNKYDALAQIHHLRTASSAHGGPNFMGWHRVYLVIAENALREKVPNVTLPYWDNTLDQALPDPRLSILWSPLFMGTGTGVISTGPFVGWSNPYGILRRNVGNDRKLMTPNDLLLIFSRQLLAEITNPSAPEASNLEELHNDVHVWVGEQMSRIESSSYDPLFFLHHTYIDCLWEEFRNLQRRRGIDPARDFPRIVGDNAHQPLASMGLGRLLVIDGINDIFTRRIYRCEARPQCVPNTNHCGSPYLRCNWNTQRCMPLVMNVGPVNQRQAVRQQQSPWWQTQNNVQNGFNNFNAPVLFR